MKTQLETLLKILLWIFLFSLLVVGYHIYYLPYHYHHQNLNITHSSISKQFDQFKIIYISDLNYHPTKQAQLEKIIKEIQYKNPHIVIFGGNLLFRDYRPSPQESSQISELLKKIPSTHGKFFHFSTHEYQNPELQETIKSIMHSAYFENISSKITKIHNHKKDFFQLAAPKNPQDEVLKQLNHKHFTLILLPSIHNITHFKTAKHYYFLSGGTNGGLVNIPFFGSFFHDLRSPYQYGTYNLNNTSPLYVTSGLSPDREALRINSHNEILIITITSIK